MLTPVALRAFTPVNIRRLGMNHAPPAPTTRLLKAK
jgi:hypothetical protein